MRTHSIRRLSAGAGLLAAAVWLSLPPADVRGAVPAEVGDEYLKAQIAALQKGLEKQPPEKAAINTYKGQAMLIALYAQQAGKNDVRDQALKVAGEIAKKNYAGAKTEAGKLTAPPAGGKAAVDLHKQHKFDVNEVMGPFRNAPRGLDWEKNIKKMAQETKTGVSDVKLAGELGAAAVLAGEYTLQLPVDDAKGANKAKWDNPAKDMVKVGGEIAAEAAKGAKADKKVLATKLASLDAACTNCHNVFKN